MSQMTRTNATSRDHEDWHAEYQELSGRPSRVYGALYFKGIRSKSFDVAVKADGTFDVTVGSQGKKVSFRHKEKPCA